MPWKQSFLKVGKWIEGWGVEILIQSWRTRHTEDTDEGRPGEFVWVFEGLEEEEVFLNDVVLVLLIKETLIEISKIQLPKPTKHSVHMVSGFHFRVFRAKDHPNAMRYETWSCN